MTVIFKILGLDVSVSPSDFNNFDSVQQVNLTASIYCCCWWSYQCPACFLETGEESKTISCSQPVQGLSAFDLCETQWAYRHLISLAACEAQSAGRCGCYTFLFQWVSLHPLSLLLQEKRKLFYIFLFQQFYEHLWVLWCSQGGFWNGAKRSGNM